TIWQMDNELAVAAVLLSACGASWLMPGVAGAGAAARLSRSLALSESASCALAVAAKANQTEKITAKLPDVLPPPPHGLQLRGTGDPMWMIAQAFLRHKHLRKLATRESVGARRFVRQQSGGDHLAGKQNFPRPRCRRSARHVHGRRQWLAKCRPRNSKKAGSWGGLARIGRLSCGSLPPVPVVCRSSLARAIALSAFH